MNRPLGGPLKHGHCLNGRSTGTYKCWEAMQRRCRSEKQDKSGRYIKRGITVCDRWCGIDGFKNFLSDMGDRPEDMSLDRLNNDGNYTPENCRWATWIQQASNRHNCVYVTIDKERMALSEACRRQKIGYSTVRRRLRLGWSMEKALTWQPCRIRTIGQ